MIADPKSLADSIDTEHINTMCTRTEGSLKRPATIDLSELRFWRERVLVLGCGGPQTGGPQHVFTRLLG